MHTIFGTDRVTGRYLTLFYGITLGFAIILAFMAIFLHGDTSQEAVPPIATQVILSKTATPFQKTTQEQSRTTPTSLPAIPPTPNEKTPTSLGITAADLRGVEVNLWHPWSGATGAELENIVDEFNRTNQWGITVRTSGYEGFGRLDEAVESALLTNTQPDVILDYGYQARHWDGVEALVDMNPYVIDPVWGMTNDEQVDFYPAFWAEDEIENNSSGKTRRLGIPYYRAAYMLFYNQSLAEELGYPKPPITLEDFRVRACAAAKIMREQGDKSNFGEGGWLITPQPGLLAGWIYTFGGEITNPEDQGYLFNTPETRQAFEYLKGLQKAGCAWVDSTVDPRSEFANRHTLFLVGSLFDIPAQQEAFTQSGNSDVWTVLPFPSDHQPNVDAYGPSLLITRSNPARQLAAWLAIKWLVYPPNQAKGVAAFKAYPTRQSTLSYLNTAGNESPQWAEALELLSVAKSEPSLPSWRVMRWALADVIGQLFNPQFTADQIPALLEKLDSVADEIYAQVY